MLHRASARSFRFRLTPLQTGGALLLSRPHNPAPCPVDPDIVNDNGELFITETFKSKPYSEVKTHPIGSRITAMLFSQQTIATVAAGVAASLAPGKPATFAATTFPDFFQYPSERYGFSVDLWITSGTARAGPPERLFAAAASKGSTVSVAIDLAANGTASVVMTDGAGSHASWHTDPVCSHRLGQSGRHHVALIADGGPKMFLWVVDGHLCDGGPHGYGYTASTSAGLAEGTSAGWALFDNTFGSLHGIASATISPSVLAGRIYSRALYVTECIGNWRAGIADF